MPRQGSAVLGVGGIVSYARYLFSPPLRSKMTVKAAEASGPTLTYSKMRGMVAILIGERRGACFFEDARWGAVIFLAEWLNDFCFPFFLFTL